MTGNTGQTKKFLLSPPMIIAVLGWMILLALILLFAAQSEPEATAAHKRTERLNMTPNYDRLMVDMSIYTPDNYITETPWRTYYADLRRDINVLKAGVLSSDDAHVVTAFINDRFELQMRETSALLKDPETLTGSILEHFMMNYIFDWAAYVDSMSDSSESRYAGHKGRVNAWARNWIDYIESPYNVEFFYKEQSPRREINEFLPFHSRAWFRMLHVTAEIANTPFVDRETRQRAVRLVGAGLRWLVQRRKHSSLSLSEVKVSDMPVIVDDAAWWHHHVSIQEGQLTKHGYFLEIQNAILYQLEGTPVYQRHKDDFDSAIDALKKASANKNFKGIMPFEKVFADGFADMQPEGYPPYLLWLALDASTLRSGIGFVSVQWRPAWFYTPEVYKAITRLGVDIPGVTPGTDSEPDSDNENPDVPEIPDKTTPHVTTLEQRQQLQQLLLRFLEDVIRVLKP